MRNLQATIGNQAVTRMLGGDPRPGSTASAAARVENWLQAEAERRLTRASPPDHAAGPDVAVALRSPGRPLDIGLRLGMERAFGYDFSMVRVHTDPAAATSASGFGTAAYTVGRHIVFAADRYAPETPSGRSLLAHELGHVVQQDASAINAALAPTLPILPGGEPEATATHWADIVAHGGAIASPSGGRHRPAVMPQGGVIRKVLKFAGRRLSRKTVATVSKHIARHARRIAGRAIHTVFRNPRKIRTLIQGTVREATELAARHAGSAAGEVIEEGAIRLTRQATGTPGKFRYVVEKVFPKAIGTQGERVLRIVLDQTGRIVTAFPADRLAAIGLSVAAIETVTAGTARAGELAREHAERDAELAVREAEREESSWEEWIPFLGDIWGGSLNVGENAALRRMREEEQIEQLISETIADVEATEQRSLDVADRQELDQLIRAAISSPLMEDEELQEGEEAEIAPE
jgi:Domain of unknown function (DUF4157)